MTVSDYPLKRVIKMFIQKYILKYSGCKQFRGKDNLKELICFINFCHHLVMRSIMTHELQMLYLLSDSSLNVTCTGDPFSTKTTTSPLQSTGIVIHFFSYVKAIQ